MALFVLYQCSIYKKKGRKVLQLPHLHPCTCWCSLGLGIVHYQNLTLKWMLLEDELKNQQEHPREYQQSSLREPEPRSVSHRSTYIICISVFVLLFLIQVNALMPLTLFRKPSQWKTQQSASFAK